MPAVIQSRDDVLLPFQIHAGALRGRLVRLGPALAEIEAGHDYPRPVGLLLAETLVLTAGLAGGLKYDGIFTLQAQGDGPVPLVLGDVTSAGDLRGYARHDAAGIGGPLGVDGQTLVSRLVGRGHLAFTVDQGPDTDRYQGIVDLAGPTLADCVQLYFRQSEQIPTVVKVAARPPDEGGGWRAAALLLQRMPAANWHSAEEGEENWREAAVLLASATAEELLDADLAPEALLYRLFHMQDLAVHPGRPLRARCRCSDERVARTLRAFPLEEIRELKDDGGRVVVTCEFCKNDYVFDDAALERLYAT